MGGINKIKIVHKDILSGLESSTEKTLILHGCNCFHIMGAGIAWYLRNKYPEIYRTDRKTPYGDRNKLGTISFTTISPTLVIGNCYTQFDLGNKGDYKPPVRYLAVGNALSVAVKTYPDYSFRLPKIGCGLAGGDWEKVEKIYLEKLVGIKYTVYEK